MSSKSSSLARTVKLRNGYIIPQVHLGLYEVDGPDVLEAVPWALKTGYRGVDSAQWYYNEAEAGQAIMGFLNGPENTEKLSREDIIYTSKLYENSTSYDKVLQSIRDSVEICGLDYIDLFLLHSPIGGREARLTSWKAIEDAIEEGIVLSGGISNFGVRHVEELMESNPRIPPAVNQIEVHPFNTRGDIRAACANHGIVVEAYAPLARAKRMRHPTILKLSKRYDCSPAQLMVRWSLQHSLIPLPKSIQRHHQIENANVEWFEISGEDMETLDALDEGLVTDWDPTDAP